MPSIDINELAAAIAAAVKGELETGFNQISGFVRSQSKRLATQAALITEGRITGQIDADLLEFFSEQLRTMTLNFARAVAQRAIITLQRAWNAAADVIWGAINTALGAAGFAGLPIPKLPKTQ